MALASPTPMGSSHFASLSRSPASQLLKQQSVQSQLEMAGASLPRTYSLGDSSDDEIPVPIFKCSALTDALLNDAAAVTDNSHATIKKSSPEPHPELNTEKVKRYSIELVDEKISPNMIREQSRYPKRKVRLSRTPGSSSLPKPRPASLIENLQSGSAVERVDNPLDLSTPAPVPKRTVKLTSSSGDRVILNELSNKVSSRENSAPPSSEAAAGSQEYPSTVTRPSIANNPGSVSRYGQPTIGRIRYGEDVGVKKIAGAFMSVRPRRGRRHISDEEQSPSEENGNQMPETKELHRSEFQGHGLVCSQESPLNYGSVPQSQYRSGSPRSSRDSHDSVLRATSPPHPVLPDSRSGSSRPRETFSTAQPAFIVPAPHSKLQSSREQENEAPPTFKRHKQLPIVNLGKMEKAQIRYDEIKPYAIRRETSSERPALALKSQNTPQRPAPPPPKMSILETATSTAGAATATVKRNRLKVNGKIFTRLDCIGRGGSSRVYRVMAENSKFFALKKVSLDDADESAVRGFKGEIDLLRKLEGVERVIRLYDFELNEEKGTLTVVSSCADRVKRFTNKHQLMEMGELDMNKILELRLKSDGSKFDPSFVRHYWKEMLECLQAIHEHDVVHSDLKPHNFVLVQGRLKLIDFGIANAIQIDETVNVHRETQIGTPNYMSPESLMDFNGRPDSQGRIANAPKLMKLGKPSDVWSLGCILYQMTYGRAPFAHIQNQMQRCQAIINFNYAIEYPPVGIGNVPVPTSLIHTLKRCLNRDQHQRPTATALLADTDPFLHPVELDDRVFPMTEELLGRIFLNVAAKIRDKTPSDAELLKLWPQGYFDSLRKSRAEGRAL